MVYMGKGACSHVMLWGQSRLTPSQGEITHPASKMARTHVSCTSRQTLNHCATREALEWRFLKAPQVIVVCSQLWEPLLWLNRSVYKTGKLSPREESAHTLSPRALMTDSEWQLGSPDPPPLWPLWSYCLGLCLGSKGSLPPQRAWSSPPAPELNSLGTEG